MLTFGAYSYAAVGFFYFVLSLLLIASWRGRLMGGLLIAACVTSAAWGVVLAAYPSFPSSAIFAVEVLRSAAWLTFLIALAGTLGLPKWIRVPAHLTWIGTLIVGITFWAAHTLDGESGGSGQMLIHGGLLMALAGLVLVVQLYRNSPADARWAIRLLLIGLGGMFAYDLFLYSQGEFFDVIDATSWSARGVVNLLLMPLIAVSAQRNPQWDLNVFVSRRVVFFTTTLLAVGLYLMLMSIGGHYIQLYGGTSSTLVRTIFFVGALLVLVVLLLSTTLRAQLKVFLVKHFFRNKYDYREEWLRLISTLSKTDGRSTGETLIQAMAQMVDSPGGVLWSLREKESGYLLMAKFQLDIDVPDIASSDSIVEFMKKRSWLIDLQEFRDTKGLYGDLVLPEWLQLIKGAWLIIPLLSGRMLRGVMILLEPTTVPLLNYEDRDLLKTAGQHMAVHLAQEESDMLLAEAQQFEAFNRLTAFLMHDLKNLIAQQSLILKNAERHKRNPEFVDDAMATIANSVKRMNKVIGQLKRGQGMGASRHTLLKYLVSNAVDRCAGSAPVAEIALEDEGVAVNANVEQFSMVLQHLIRNAQDATPGDGSIVVTVSRDNGMAKVAVRDTGCGMTADFIRDRLFKPFDSTKGSQGMGIGAHQAREFARNMGGDVVVDSVPGEGTNVELSLPAV